MEIKIPLQKYTQYLRFLLWGVVFLILFLAIHGVFSEGLPGGWDTQGHYYLAEETTKHLKDGQLTFYDEKWFAGYPAFPLYGPLFYYLIAFFHLISFQVLPVLFLFKLALFLFPFLFVIAFVFASKKWFGKSSELFALPVSMVFLLVSKLHNAYGIGIASYTMAGLIPNFLGIVLLLFYLGSLKTLLEKPIEYKSIVLSGTLFASCFYTNPSIGVFALVVFLFIWFSNGLKNKNILLSGGITGLLLLPFVFQLFRYLPYASSSNIGYSEIATMPLISVLFFQVDHLIRYPSELLVNLNLYTIPFLGLLSLLLFIIGILALLKRKHYSFPLIFLFSLGIVVFELDFGFLQSFRFITLVFLMELLIITFGAQVLFTWVQKKQLSAQSWLLVFSVIVLAFTQLVFYQYDLLRNEGYHRSQQFQFSVEDYPQSASLNELESYLKQQEGNSRIAVDSTLYMFVELGGVHIASSHLATNGLAVVPGLLAESSLSSAYIIPPLKELYLSIPWGKRELLKSYEESSLGFVDHIKRLELYGVDTVIAYNPGAEQAFSRNQDEAVFEKAFESEFFTVYDLHNALPIVSEPKYAPIVFVSKSKQVFRDFTEQWYLKTDLLPYSIIYVHPSELSELLSSHGEQIGGVILEDGDVDVSRSYTYDRNGGLSDELEQWIKDTKQQTDITPTMRIERRSYTPNEKKNGGYWHAPSFVFFF